MVKNKKRANEGEGAGSASPPPLKRQKIGAASSSTAVSDEMAARNLLLEQRLQSSEDENARLKERLQLQEEEIQKLQVQEEKNIKDCIISTLVVLPPLCITFGWYFFPFLNKKRAICIILLQN